MSSRLPGGAAGPRPFMYAGLALPENLKESIDAYATSGRPTGDFLRACIANDLCDAAVCADDRNLLLLGVIAVYIWRVVPQDARGSDDKISQWITRKLEERRANAPAE